MGLRTAAAILAVLLALLTLAGCGSAPLLSGVAASPDRITPNGDRVDDTTAVAYTLARPARITIEIVDATGQRHLIRDDLERPAGTYEAGFDGAVAVGDNPAQRQVVPAGEYTFVVKATDGTGRSEERDIKLTVAEPDRDAPRLENMSALPAEISPFDPQLERETRVSYRLTKEATVTTYAVDPTGRRSRLSEPIRLDAGEHSFVWDGLIRNKIPEAGASQFVVEARDAAGNATEAAATVVISGTEEPDAIVVRTNFSPRSVMKGDLVKVEITVRNTGTTTLRSQGPDPGYVYTTRDTFASVEDGLYGDGDRVWRVGVDWAGGLGPEGARYPYRWGFGKDLAPGEEITVEGYVRILEDYPQIRMYAGLIHERVKYQVDKVGSQLIEVSH